MNNTYRTDFEKLRIPTLENIHRGITHKIEVLQEKMAVDMGRSTFYDILPRNYSILPVDKCSLHDLEQLEKLHEKSFHCHWTMENKKAIEKNNLPQYEAEFKLYSFLDGLNDIEQKLFFEKLETRYGQRMSTHKIIQEMIQSPNFLEEVNV